MSIRFLKDRFPTRRANWPYILGAALGLLVMVWLLRGLLGRIPLVYGDVPLFDRAISKVNFLYSWDNLQLGTSVRQGFNTMRDQVFYLLAPNTTAYFFLKYLLPIFLVPVSYVLVLRRFGIRDPLILIVSVLAVLASPILFGDILTGQTMWVYLFLPWVFYFLTRLVYYHDYSLRTGLLLGLSIFLVFGMLPPLIVPVMAVATLYAGILLLMSRFRPLDVVRTAAVGGLAVVLFAALAWPYLSVASSGQSSFTPPSLVGDYMHNYGATTLDRTLRMAGNAGNGQQTLGYNEGFRPVNIAGFVVMLVIVIGFMHLRGRADRESRDTLAVVAAMLALLLGIFFFLHLMTVNQQFGLWVFQRGWLASTIRSPTKIFVITLPLFIIAFAVALAAITERRRRSVRIPVIALTALLLGIYGWPLMRGDLGLFYGKDPANYRPDAVMAAIAEDARRSPERSIVLPSTHRDELNYETVAPALNTVKFEGGLPATAGYMGELKNSFRRDNPQSLDYLRNAGIRYVYLKKDAARKADPFTLFSTSARYAETRDFLLANGARQVADNPDYGTFQLDAKGTIFAAERIVSVRGSDKISQVAPLLGDQESAIVYDAAALPAVSRTYRWYDSSRIPTDGKADEVIAELFDARVVNLAMRRSGSDVAVTRSDPYDGSEREVSRLSNVPAGAILGLDGDYARGLTEQSAVTMRAGSHDLTIASLTDVTRTNQDLSFESRQPQVGDATPRAPGKADVYGRIVPDARSGRNALLIGSKGHTAFVALNVAPYKARGTYLVNLDYKHLRGEGLRYAIYAGPRLIASSPTQLSTEAGWQRLRLQVDSQAVLSGPMRLYLYSRAAEGQQTENIVDTVSVQRVDELRRSKLEVSPNVPARQFSAGQAGADLSRYATGEAPNLVTNGDFTHKKASWSVEDPTDLEMHPGKKLRTSLVRNVEDGSPALKIEAEGSTGYVSQKLTDFKRNAVYRVSFDYKSEAGYKPYFAIWQGGANLSNPIQRLDTSRDWKHVETYFSPEADATSLSFFFYGPTNTGKSVNLLDNVVVEEVSPFAGVLAAEPAPTSPYRNDLRITGHKRLDPTMVEVRARPTGSGGLLVFNESFHAGWQAYVVPADYVMSPKDKLTGQVIGRRLGTHVMANGFTNAWQVDKLEAGQKLLLVYAPQFKMYRGLAMTFVTLALVAGYFILSRQLRRR